MNIITLYSTTNKNIILTKQDNTFPVIVVQNCYLTEKLAVSKDRITKSNECLTVVFENRLFGNKIHLPVNDVSCNFVNEIVTELGKLFAKTTKLENCDIFIIHCPDNKICFCAGKTETLEPDPKIFSAQKIKSEIYQEGARQWLTIIRQN